MGGGFFPNHYPLSDPFSPSLSLSPPSIAAQKQAKVITIPVQDANHALPHHTGGGGVRAPAKRGLPTRSPRIQMDQPTAALKIQSRFRGYLVRRCNPLKHLRTIANVKERLAEYEAEIQKPSVRHMIREHRKERLRITEGIMALLLKLDAIQGAQPEIRDMRKATTKRVIQLQEAVDAMVEGRQYPTPQSTDTGSLDQFADNIPVAGTDTSVSRLNDIGTSQEPLETLPVVEMDSVLADHSCKVDERNAVDSRNPSLTAALAKNGGILEPSINLQAASSAPSRIDSSALAVEDLPVHGEKASREILSPDGGGYGHRLAQTDIERATKRGGVQDIDPMDIYPGRELHGPAASGVKMSPEEEQYPSTSVEEEHPIEERSSQPEGSIVSTVRAPDGTIVGSNLENAVVPQDIGVVDKFTVANPDPEDLKAMESEVYMHKAREKRIVGEGGVLDSELSHCPDEQRPLDREVLERLIQENKKLKQALEELCKKNQKQDAMISLLNDKFQQLEKQVTWRRYRRRETDGKKKKRRAHSDISLSLYSVDTPQQGGDNPQDFSPGNWSPHDLSPDNWSKDCS